VGTPSSPLSGRSYLVTGGAGFIGSHLVGALLERGADVICLDDFNDFYSPNIKEEAIAPFQKHDRFRLHRTDIRDAESVRAIIAGEAESLKTGGIIHLAARAGVRPSLEHPRLYLETNVGGTLNLLEAARASHIRRFVFASSSSVYGDRPATGAFREDEDVSKPISPYASTKVMCESLLHSYAHLYGFRVVALRFFTVYGPGQRPDLAIHKFTRLIDEGLPVPLFGDGSTERDYTYVEDTVSGCLAALEYDATPFEVFNLGASRTIALKQLVELIEAALTKKAEIDWLPRQPGDVTITHADVSKARQMLGYRPEISFEEGIHRFVSWYTSRKARTDEANATMTNAR